MSKLIVTANSKEHLNTLLNKNIDGIIIYLEDLSCNSSFYLDIDTFMSINFNDKEVFINLNKIMHNSDLVNLRKVLKKIATQNVKILFYDMAVYQIAKEYKIENKLIISQDHLNASSLSNKFYHDLGISGSYLTSDITSEELLNIKRHNDMPVMFLVYGYSPIFYSRRYLITNYLKYINESSNNDNYHIISDTGIEYPITEEKYGTTIYSSKIINLINYLDELNNIDYLVMNSNQINDLEFNNMVDKFINKEKVADAYIGFFKTKTIYRVK